MTILSGALALGRRAAEARMTETFQAFTRTETENDDLKTVVVETTLWESPGRLRTGGGSSGSSGVRAQGKQLVVVTRREAHLPTSAPVLPPGTFLRVISSTVDPGIVGLVSRITSRPEGGQTTARRYEVEGTT